MNKKRLKEKFDNMIKKVNPDKVDQVGKRVEEFAGDMIMPMTEWIKAGFVGIVISVFTGLIAFKILAVGGLAVVFADLMASTCVNTAVACEYNSLMGGLGFSLVFLTSFVIAFAKLIIYLEDVDRIEYEVIEDEPCRSYNEDMVKTLKTIQSLGGIENLMALANFKGIHYTTLRRYVEKFEEDGYVTVHSNGKGKPVEVRLAK